MLEKEVKKEILNQNRGQVTIFIIIAIVILAAVALYFVFGGSFQSVNVPASLQPVYNNFLNCVQQDTTTGINIIESQGGYITPPEFKQGSQEMPFSSQLNFLGNPVPYWYYVSGNGIPEEQVPSKSEMESQLSNFIENKINECDFSDYYSQGFDISWENAKADTSIKDSSIETSLNLDFSISRGNESVLVKNINTKVDSNLGTLYSSAKNVYEQEQKNLFLEQYAVDILRSYAPVDGVEITCSPLIWNADEVFDNLQEAIGANTGALNTESKEKYFRTPVSNIPANIDVRFLNSKNWPNSFEVSPSEGSILVANPAGNQAGLGVIGFCYVPYHFVYNVKYPVLVQVQSGDEIFQFPVAVILQGNNPRKQLNVSSTENIVPDLCLYKNTQIQVNVKNKQGVPVDARISYECFGNKCDIGQAENGALNENFPQCVNGYVVAQAEGYKTSKYLFSTTSSGSVDVILDKTYTKGLQLNLDGASYSGYAIINFIPESSGSTQTTVYPEQTTVSLSEGQYSVQVYIYKNSSINTGAATTQQCITVPSGILGVFGVTHEKCFDIEVPSQLVSQALSGGGTQNYYIIESELANGNVIEINADSLPEPDTIEKLQTNYLLFDEKGLDITFR